MSDKDPYSVLGVNRGSNDDDIKKAFRKQALKEHPDKGGDPEKFKELQSAYEILSDKDKRNKYDQFGHAGLDENMMNRNSNSNDIFDSFFKQSFNFPFGVGPGSRAQSRGGPSKDPSVKRTLPVSLKDLYVGKTIRLSVTRNKILGDTITCVECSGRGSKVEIRQIGPGMIQQSHTTCRKCRGAGEICDFVKENKVISLDIEKGMRHETVIKFPEMGDENINRIPADVLFVINEQPHSVFKRKNNDLLIVRDISIYDVFVDYEFILDLLDETRVLIKVKANTIKSPSYKLDNGSLGFVNEPFVLSANGLGMPKVNTGGLLFGDLFVIFNIVFPNGEFDESKIRHKSCPSAEVDSCETYYLKGDSIRRFGR